MAVPEQTPYSEHTGNGVTKSFALNFDCESKDHLIVLVDEIEPPIATWSLTGGNVVFTTAPAAGKKITAQRNTPFSRNVDYQSYNNSFRPPAVNKDFDWIWWKLQELGVADWILGARIDALKNYVDRKDDELKAYLMEEIRKQGVALDQLDDYYNYLMQRLAQIAVDKGWDASFVVDASGKTQQEINTHRLRTLRSFGCVGDGITDDTLAFQRAIDSGEYVLGNSGDTYLVSRQYVGITGSMEIDSYCLKATTSTSIIDLCGATILRQKIGDGDSIKQYPIAYIDGANKLTIKNGTVDFNNQNVLGFVYTFCSKPDQGLINLRFINTRNSGTPRTVLPNNNSLVFIRSCDDDVYVRDCSFYIGSNGDLSGDAPASFDNPTFGVRITTSLFSVTPDDPEVIPVKNCYVVNSKFYGAFTWQPIEIGGSKAFNCYMKDIFMYKPVLTAIDIDKGAIRCYAKNVQIVSPRKGLPTVPINSGAWEYIVMRIQGYIVGDVDIYADSCWVEDVDIYDLPNDINHYVNTEDNLGTLICFAQAKNSRFTNIRVHGNGALRWLVRSFGEESLNNTIEKLSGGHYLAVTGDSVGTAGVVDTGNIRILNSVFGCYRGVLVKNQYKISIEGCSIKSSVAERNNVPSYFLGTEADSKAEVTIKNSTFTGFWKAVALTDNLPTKLYLQGNKFLEQTQRSAVGLLANSVDNIDHVKGDVWTYGTAYNIPSLANGEQFAVTATMQGVRIGDTVNCSMSIPMQGLFQWAEVTSANTVTVYTRNNTGVAVDLPTGTLYLTRVA